MLEKQTGNSSRKKLIKLLGHLGVINVFNIMTSRGKIFQDVHPILWCVLTHSASADLAIYFTEKFDIVVSADLSVESTGQDSK